MRGTEPQGEFAPLQHRLDTKQGRRATCSRQRDGSKADRAGAKHDHSAARLEAARPRKHALVGNADRLTHGANLQRLLGCSVAIQQSIEAPARLRRRSDCVVTSPV